MDRLHSSSPISIQAPLQWEGSVGVDRVQQGFSSHTSSFSSDWSGFLPPGCRKAIGADVPWRRHSISTKRCWREKPSSFLPLTLKHDIIDRNLKGEERRRRKKGWEPQEGFIFTSQSMAAQSDASLPEALIRLSFLHPKVTNISFLFQKLTYFLLSLCLCTESNKAMKLIKWIRTWAGHRRTRALYVFPHNMELTGLNSQEGLQQCRRMALVCRATSASNPCT